MSLSSGTRLGPYEIVSQIGAGGMGEVYKATDTRLNRTVAIKVLPPHFINQPEMKARFDREAQVIAGLHHPNICVLYDVGREGDTDFLVMEYLEGDTLSARIATGPLPLDEALAIAVQIADALDKAHAQNITHRDLKPGNVMLTPQGAKLLDFGLAKFGEPAQAGAAAGTVLRSGVSVNTTAPGMIIGTMQYMAPEQLEGRDADARTDIFAFGSVLYEIITGRKAFEGKSQPHLIAAIISAEPEPASKLQPAVPPALDFLIKRCLAKDPEERLQTATDLVNELKWIAAGGEGTAPVPVVAPKARRSRAAQLALALVILVAAATAIVAFALPAKSGPKEDTRFMFTVPGMPVTEAVSISPDGRLIAYSGNDGGSPSVFVRPIDTEAPRKLAGTEGAGRLFWSPDSRWIAFFSGGKLKKIEGAGGPALDVCDTPELFGGTWNIEGVIVFANAKGLQRVAAAGGVAAPVTVTGDGPRDPYFLPDGRHFLYTAKPGILAASLGDAGSTSVLAVQSNAVYADGHLLYHRDGTLYAQPFSTSKLATTGDPVRLADKIPVSAGGAAAFAAATANVLLFRKDPPPAPVVDGRGSSVGRPPLRWVPRSGGRGRGDGGEDAAEAGGWRGPDIAPDGKRFAVHRHDPDGGDIWIFTAGQTTPSRFTFDATLDNSSPIWSPDGSRIAFASNRNGKFGIYVKAADNTKAEEPLLELDQPSVPMSWSGNRLVFWTRSRKTAGDVWILPLDGDRKPVPFLETGADERTPQVSPDGKWIAYSSNDTGRSEIFVRAFPDGPGRIQVSVNGGVFPRWKKDGKELYFMSLVSIGSAMASTIRVSGASIEREVPKSIFQSFYVFSGHAAGINHAYAVSPDGGRFLIPQFEGLVATFGRDGRGGASAAAAAVLADVVADRHAAASPASQSNAPINVVLDWPALLQAKPQ